MRIRLSSEQVTKVAEFLKGTNRSPAEALVSIGFKIGARVMDDVSARELETLVFRCRICSFWKSIEDSAASGTDNVCQDCDDAADAYLAEEREGDEIY